MGRPRTDIQPRLVRAARERFLRDGVDGSSLRDIASDAGTSVGMVFYYFPTKDDLFLAVVEQSYACILERIENILSNGMASLRDRLRGLSAMLGELSEEEIEVVRLVASEALLSSVRFEQLFARFRRGHLAMLLRALKGGVDAGDVDPRVPLPILMLASLGLVAVPQFVRRAVGHETPFAMLPAAEELAEKTIDVLFRGIEPREKLARLPSGAAPAKARAKKS